MALRRSSMLAVILFTSVLRADPATTQPAPAALYNGKVEFIPPADWSPVKSPQSSELVAVYVADDHDGYLAIQLLPENATISPAAAHKIVVQLRANHKRAGQEIVSQPTIENDPRFAIKIHERYKTKEGSVADETHLYRQVAGRALELDVQSLSEDPAHRDAVRKAGEEMLASAEWKAGKPKKKTN